MPTQYKIVGASGTTPSRIKQVMSRAEVMEKVEHFIAWNPSRKNLPDDASKIVYFNQRSFYEVVEIEQASEVSTV